MRDDPHPPYTYDDDLIEATARDAQTRVRVYRVTDTVVVLGSGSRSDSELNLGACREDGVPILRRRGGGCAVVLDPGNVIVSVTAGGLPFGHHRRHFDLLTGWLIAGLDRTGFNGIRQAGICDLVIGDRKVGGACLHRHRDRLYYSASLLYDADITRLARYLAHPPREPDYRRGRPHASFVMPLRDAAPGRAHTAETVAARLRQALSPPDLRSEAAIDSPRSPGGRRAPGRRSM
jgi:lipoate-protein ligase A